MPRFFPLYEVLGSPLDPPLDWPRTYAKRCCTTPSALHHPSLSQRLRVNPTYNGWSGRLVWLTGYFELCPNPQAMGVQTLTETNDALQLFYFLRLRLLTDGMCVQFLKIEIELLYNCLYLLALYYHRKTI